MEVLQLNDIGFLSNVLNIRTFFNEQVKDPQAALSILENQESQPDFQIAPEDAPSLSSNPDKPVEALQQDLLSLQVALAKKTTDETSKENIRAPKVDPLNKHFGAPKARSVAEKVLERRRRDASKKILESRRRDPGSDLWNFLSSI